MAATEHPAVALAAEHCYGYGNRNAKYWFIGPEPGRSSKEGNNLARRCEAWLELCPDGPESGDLIDNFDHHKLFDRQDLFLPRPGQRRVANQKTWMQLIRLLLTYEDQVNDNDATAAYQANSWGRLDSDTCVVEMSALAMPSLKAEQALRKSFRPARARRLREMILAARPSPRFVVMYGGGEEMRPYWQLIGCGDTEANCFQGVTIVDDWSADFASDGHTIFVIAKHPVKRGAPAPPKEYWTGIAAEIHRRRQEL